MKVGLLIAILLGTIVLCIAGMILFFVYYAFQGKSVLIQAKGYALKGRLYDKSDKEKAKPAILFLSGWNPGKSVWTTGDFYAGYCTGKMDTVCLTVAFRGMGSDWDINKLSRSDFLDDAVAAYDYLAGLRGVDPARITVVGESFGSYMASVLSSKRPVKNLVLRVPTDFPADGFADVPQIKFAGNLSREWKLREHYFGESVALKAVHDFKGNMIIIASENDEMVPFQTIENYRIAAADFGNANYQLMKGAGHGLFSPAKIREYLKILSEWLKWHF